MIAAASCIDWDMEVLGREGIDCQLQIFEYSTSLSFSLSESEFDGFFFIVLFVSCFKLTLT